MSYYYFKTFHIIFVVTWFAGLFYLGRLFVYHAQAQEMGQENGKILVDQYLVMERRLWFGITWPSCILALFFGLLMLKNFLPLSQNPWLVKKLILVMALISYHFLCGKMVKKLRSGIYKASSEHMRWWNEVPTFFLVLITMLVVFKEQATPLQLFATALILALIVVLGILAYKKKRTKNIH